FNKQIKRYSRRKEQFQNEESLERFLVSIFDTYNQKFGSIIYGTDESELILQPHFYFRY
ncbi:IS256 family transposase, partial [Enterococcus faecium]